MRCLFILLLLAPAQPDWWAIDCQPGVGMTHAEAEQQARAWFGMLGHAPYAWRRPDGVCCVGGYGAVGEGPTWEAAFQEARGRGWDPARGYDWAVPALSMEEP